jgi:hypothetical protein
MTQPLSKIGKSRTNMGRPVRVGISLLQPGKRGPEFASSRRKRDAISKINASITQGKQFCAQEIAPIEAAKTNGLTQKQRLEALLPAGQKVIRKRSRSVVQPIVLEYVSLLATDFPEPISSPWAKLRSIR